MSAATAYSLRCGKRSLTPVREAWLESSREDEGMCGCGRLHLHPPVAPSGGDADQGDRPHDGRQQEHGEGGAG